MLTFMAFMRYVRNVIKVVRSICCFFLIFEIIKAMILVM